MIVSQAEDNAEEYRPISTLAVLALIAGCSSFLALISQILWVIPILAGGLSLAAIRDTSIGKSHKAGRGLALIGLALSVGFGAQSFSVFSVNAWIDHSRARETVLRWHQAIRDGEWDVVHGFCTPGLIPVEEVDHDGPDHDGHSHGSEESRKLSEIKELRNFPAVRSLAACNRITLTDIVRGNQRYQGSLHVTIDVGECESHSEDSLPHVVDLWLQHTTQEEPEVGEDAAGFQRVEIWQIIRIDPSE